MIWSRRVFRKSLDSLSSLIASGIGCSFRLMGVTCIRSTAPPHKWIMWKKVHRSAGKGGGSRHAEGSGERSQRSRIIADHPVPYAGALFLSVTHCNIAYVVTEEARPDSGQKGRRQAGGAHFEGVQAESCCARWGHPPSRVQRGCNNFRMGDRAKKYNPLRHAVRGRDRPFHNPLPPADPWSCPGPNKSRR